MKNNKTDLKLFIFQAPSLSFFIFLIYSSFMLILFNFIAEHMLNILFL